MRARGLVEEVVAPEGAPDDERQRRTYALTELGRRIAVAEARRLDALVADAKRVLGEI
jgi:hypothetical protein